MRCSRCSSSPTSPGSTSMPKSAMGGLCRNAKPGNSPIVGASDRTGRYCPHRLGGWMSDDVRDPLAAGVIPEQGAPVDAELRSFLIADVRGYTAFTQRHGDEAAARLAGKFARVTREVVDAEQGRVVELRGDEALCVFTSPRQAVRAAIALQRRFVDETKW